MKKLFIIYFILAIGLFCCCKSETETEEKVQEIEKIEEQEKVNMNAQKIYRKDMTYMSYGNSLYIVEHDDNYTLKKSVDGGSTFITCFELSQNFYVKSFDNNIVVVYYEKQYDPTKITRNLELYISKDAGNNWISVGSVAEYSGSNIYYSLLSFYANNIYISICSRLVKVSTENLVKSVIQTGKDVIVDEKGDCYGRNGKELYRSTDGGNTWTLIYSTGSNTIRDYSSNGKGVIVITCGNGFDSVICISKNYGMTWSPKIDRPSPLGAYSTCCYGSLIFIGDVGKVYYSTDFCNTLIPILLDKDLTPTNIFYDGNKVYIYERNVKSLYWSCSLKYSDLVGSNTLINSHINIYNYNLYEHSKTQKL